MAQILVVDGSVFDRKRIAAVLQAAGHEVVESGSAAEARRQLLKPGNIFQLVITELQLPDADGLTFIRAVKSDAPAGASLPVLVVTPLQSRDVVIETILAGAEHMVAKPFAGEILLRRVTEILATHSLTQEAGEQRVSWSLDQFLRRESKRANRTGQPLSVLVLRVPPGGDRHLAETVARQVQVRETDLVFAFDEGVAMVLPDTDALGARVVEARIRQALAQLRPAGGAAEQAGSPAAAMAVGTATMPDDARDAESLLALASRWARPVDEGVQSDPPNP